MPQVGAMESLAGRGVRSQGSPRLRYDSSVNHVGTREAAIVDAADS